MSEQPQFISFEEALLIQGMQIEGFGGRPGLRDITMLHSALDRPKNRWHYERGTIPQLASEDAFGIARNHPFVDGNKRAAFMTAFVFLRKNGFQFLATEAEVVLTFVSLAAGEMSAEALSVWFEANSIAESTD